MILSSLEWDDKIGREKGKGEAKEAEEVEGDLRCTPSKPPRSHPVSPRWRLFEPYQWRGAGRRRRLLTDAEGGCRVSWAWGGGIIVGVVGVGVWGHRRCRRSTSEGGVIVGGVREVETS
jgi:hypothetical protein